MPNVECVGCAIFNLTADNEQYFCFDFMLPTNKKRQRIKWIKELINY